MLGIELRRNAELSLARQIYQALRDLMLSGRLKPGEAVPSTRELAEALAVSRNTACEAYEMLAAEGYIITRQGSPTRVADGLCLDKPEKAAPDYLQDRKPRKYLADFRTGQPDLQLFPKHLWLQLLRNGAEDFPLGEWGYNNPEGLPALRQEIADWLLRSRGIKVEPHDVFITAGATQALHLLANLLFQEGRRMLVEDPCHLGMLRCFQSRGFEIQPVPVDKYGIQTEFLADNSVCAAYLTPSHQFPLGGILTATRRAELIRFARKNSIYLIEDDYDSEFRYTGPPIAPLVSLDQDRVIYVGTFSKILFPALRIGYVILPNQLQSPWRKLRTHVDIQNPPFEQAALAEFLRTRKLDRHVQQMRKLYGKRRQALLEALTATFGNTWQAHGDSAGLHIAVEFPGKLFNQAFVAECQQCGLNITPVAMHCIRKETHQDKLLLGYGHLELAEIRKGIKLLHEQIQKQLP